MNRLSDGNSLCPRVILSYTFVWHIERTVVMVEKVIYGHFTSKKLCKYIVCLYGHHLSTSDIMFAVIV